MATTVNVSIGNSVLVTADPNNDGLVGNPGTPLGTVTWASADNTKATVAPVAGSSGQAAYITGVGAGTVAITATAANGKTATISAVVAAGTDPAGFSIIVGSGVLS